jgi:hypothetical protein
LLGNRYVFLSTFLRRIAREDRWSSGFSPQRFRWFDCAPIFRRIADAYTLPTSPMQSGDDIVKCYGWSQQPRRSRRRLSSIFAGRIVFNTRPAEADFVAPVFSINRFGSSGTLFHLTTPCARRSAKSAVVNPRPPSTSSVCWPMAGASWWMLVGVLDRWIQGASNVVRPAVG